MNVPIENVKKWVPVSEIARKLGYTRQHFTRLCRGGTVPGARQTKGGHWRIAVTKGFVAWFSVQPRSRGSEFVPANSARKVLDTETDLIRSIFREEAKAKAAAKLSRATVRALKRRLDAVTGRVDLSDAPGDLATRQNLIASDYKSRTARRDALIAAAYAGSTANHALPSASVTSWR